VRTLNLRTSLISNNGGDPVTLHARAASDLFPSPRLFTSEMMDARVRKILIMVDSGKKFTIRNLALEFNLSPSYLRRLFKHQTGVPMGKWLSESRLRRAAQLLTNGYMSVKEIAHSVRYEHASSFIRAFERRFARAPACYRRQIDRTKC
jgi:AraC-like DNA-binding protein